MDINQYATYTVEDFLEDPEFRSWIQAPDSEKDQHWQAVFDRYPDLVPVAGQARQILMQMADFFQPEAIRQQDVDEQFVQHLQARMKATKRGNTSSSRRRKLRQSLAMAATFALLLLSVWWWQGQQPSLQAVRTNYGEWKTLYLPDSSLVQLNANSVIRFQSDWTAGADREVWLEGEAFFEVTKDAQGAKFTVYTEDLAVEVLGTAFNVHSRNDLTQVFLQEGQVRLDLGEEEKMLAPGDFVAYSGKEKTVKTFTQTSEELHTSWKDGSLIMRDKDVAEVVKKIEEIFGYQVIVENQALLGEQRTVGIPMYEIEAAIPILESIFQTTITLEDNRMIIH